MQTIIQNIDLGQALYIPSNSSSPSPLRTRYTTPIQPEASELPMTLQSILTTSDSTIPADLPAIQPSTLPTMQPETPPTAQSATSNTLAGSNEDCTNRASMAPTEICPESMDPRFSFSTTPTIRHDSKVMRYDTSMLEITDELV